MATIAGVPCDFIIASDGQAFGDLQTLFWHEEQICLRNVGPDEEENVGPDEEEVDCEENYNHEASMTRIIRLILATCRTAEVTINGVEREILVHGSCGPGCDSCVSASITDWLNDNFVHNHYMGDGVWGDSPYERDAYGGLARMFADITKEYFQQVEEEKKRLLAEKVRNDIESAKDCLEETHDKDLQDWKLRRAVGF